jgi:hypothetical protein
MDYIRIESIEDINPDKISIRDLKKRYIDANGNRYKARFNLNTRKIEIVRLALSREEAERVRVEILQNRMDLKRRSSLQQVSAPPYESEMVAGEDSLTSSEDLWQDSIPESTQRVAGPPLTEDRNITTVELPMEISPEKEEGPTLTYFNEDIFVKECIADLQKVKGRQSAMINFLKKTNLYEGSLKNSIDDILRHMDVDCWQKADDTINFYRELISYPRPITYYLAKLPEKKRKILDRSDDDFERMKMVQRWELQEELESTYRKILEITTSVESLLKENVSETYLKNLTAHHRQLVTDAEAGCEILLKECREHLAMIAKWIEKYP